MKDGVLFLFLGIKPIKKHSEIRTGTLITSLLSGTKTLAACSTAVPFQLVHPAVTEALLYAANLQTRDGRE